MHIKIAVQDENISEYDYNIDFREFCYALAKAFTEALKVSGIRGYYEATWHHDFNVEEFIYVKAFALNRLDEFRAKYSKKDGKCYSDFDKEITLLMQDM